MTTAFVTGAPVVTSRSVTSVNKCSTVGKRVSVCKSVQQKGVLKMQSGYKIEQSEYVDPEGEDDGGDGFVGESDMDDHLGVSMPDDLASFEIREIQNSETREELVEKLRAIKNRRKDIYVDRRKGLGIENANEYLRNL